MVKSQAVVEQNLIYYSSEPLNAGTPLAAQRASFLTPNDAFFVRNHAPIPEVDLAIYHLIVDGMVDQPLRLSLTDLKQRFTSHALTATISCAGYRRNELEVVAPIPGELVWQADAIGTALWRGVQLNDVLEAAGLHSDAAHVAFVGLDTEGDGKSFGGSIPLDKALASEVLLAYEMNGEPLAPEHGFPLRVVVPGYIGARSVKWLSHICVQREPSTNHYQRNAYKLFPPDVQAKTVDWQQGLMLGELPVNSVIACPSYQDVIASGRTLIRGLAIGSHGRPIECVEVSGDAGQTWHSTQITSENHEWAWCFWEASLHLLPGTHELVVRAFDVSGCHQPEHLAEVWNFKGYLNNAWYRVVVRVF